MGIFILLCMIVFILYELFVNEETSLLNNKKERMRAVRKNNAKRGITMRPNWRYRFPDGTIRMSRTGREKDMIIIK